MRGEILFIIPQPKELILDSQFFQINYNTWIVLDINCDSDDLNSALLLQEEILDVIGQKLLVTKSITREHANCIFLDKKKLPNEAYEIHVVANGIHISGGSSVGLFYGVQSLRQIVRNKGVNIPCLTIKDSPDFLIRGFYHDVTRGKVPTIETLKQLVDRMAFYKLNQLQLYIEHSFAFKKHSEVWMGTDPITPEEILILDEYCKKKHVELVPSIATFGHLYQALTTNSYNHLCELEVDRNKPYCWIDRMLHHTLDVSNPKSLLFVFDALDEFIPLFSSEKFNICCDETFDLGEGKNKKLVEKIGKGQLYIQFANQIITHVKSYNKKVMFWGDVILAHPEVLPQIPRDVTCLTWNYDEQPEEAWVETIGKSGLPQYVCPGVHGWNRLMNNMDVAFMNIKKMISYGKKYGAIGVLNTDWGDFGHINLFGNSMPGMIYGAALSWNLSSAKDDFSLVDKHISYLEFSDQSTTIMGLLRRLAKQEVVTWGDIVRWREEKFCGIAIEPQSKELFKSYAEQDVITRYHEIMDIAMRLMQLSALIPQNRKTDLQEFYISARGIALQQALYLVIKKYDLNQEVIHLIYEPEKLAVELEYWFIDYSKVWRVRNKESELYRIKEIFIQICDYLRNAIDRTF